MMKKRYLQAVLIVMTTLMMTGCGTKFPDLTDEQYKQTVEYAAGLLMKYSNNGQERLVVVDAKEVLKERQKEAARAAEIELAKEQAAKNSQKDQTPAQVQEPALEETEPEGQELTTDPDAMTENTEATEGDSSEEATEVSDPNAITLSSDESQEIMSDIFLSYQGYSVSSTYPESSKSYVVNADKSKRLLVLRFDLYNGSDTEKSVNLIPLGLSFKIILNGKDIGYSSVTFLPNDLSSYSGNIDSRAHESVVVLTQISEKEATKIESLGMIATIRGETQTIVLK
ncbi:hypothetical protein [Butyrivibrio sp. VCB2001]|uniref:hypothetical protein n=1 Tax=Butyrivibrio sp. VCB2001 TaxID=1280667 RepID=UPI00040519FB|nr:hypothetical protein [Butyrivibrio sp. VCB2001]